MAYEARAQLPNGRQLIRKFNIEKLGEKVALELAVVERQQQLKFVEGYLLHSPGTQYLGKLQSQKDEK